MTPTEAKDSLSKYKGKPFRPYQEDAIRFAEQSQKKFVFIEAPTGSGKSLIAMTLGRLMGGVTYCVHSKILQNQIVSDFPEAKSLFGRANYDCLGAPGSNCDECFHTKDTICRSKLYCIYDVEKKATLHAQLRILNYDYLLTEANYRGQFSGSRFNLIDEADNMENTLVNFTTLTFTKYALARLGLGDFASRLKQTSKDPQGLVDAWRNFVSTAEIRCKNIISKLDYQISSQRNLFDEVSDIAKKAIKEKARITRLLEKIKLFNANVDETWVLDADQEDKFIFRPLWVTPDLANEFLWRHADRWVLTSASFLPIKLEAKRLGISMDDVDYMCLQSTFPVERRLIHIEPAANITGKTMDVEAPKLCKRIKEIVDDHPNVKGLIHGVSYKLSRTIIDLVNNPRLIVHDPYSRQHVLQEFIESDKPLVLVSPSMERGVSFEMDLCRFIIVAKAPFLYLGDKIVAKRAYSSKMGKEWYAATMLITVLQMTGRGMRSEDDFCENYILDEQFKRVFSQKMGYLPPWWKDAIAW